MNARILAGLVLALLVGCVQMKGPCKRTATTVTECEAGGTIGGVNSPPVIPVK